MQRTHSFQHKISHEIPSERMTKRTFPLVGRKVVDFSKTAAISEESEEEAKPKKKKKEKRKLSFKSLLKKIH